MRPALGVTAEQVPQPDAVVLAQVGLYGLAVLSQESDEAADSPSASPQCSR